MTTAPTSDPIRRHALLIGINEYDADHLQDLQAPRNDVLTWFRFLRRLGVPAADIQVLTSPALTREELDADDADTALATAENIEVGLQRLADRLGQAGGAGFGIVFVAGHGRYGGGANLSLEMTRGEPVPLNSAMKALAAWPVTWLVDVCRPYDAGPFNGLADLLRPAEAHVVVAGSREGQMTRERFFDGAWHGQLTWAAITILRNWPVGSTACGRAYAAITPETLVEKMGALMAPFDAQGQKQEPVCAKRSDLTGPLFLPGRSEPTETYAVAAPTHEFGPGTCDFRVGTTVLANCGTRADPTPAGWRERRDWVVASSTDPNATAAEDFVARLTSPWVLVVYGSGGTPNVPAGTTVSFRGGPRAPNPQASPPFAGDPCGAQTTLLPSVDGKPAYAFKATAPGITIYANVWAWSAPGTGPRDRIGISFTLVAASGAQIPPGNYTFTTCTAVYAPLQGQNAYVWVDNLNPQP